jgi:hypothetical protein
MKIIFHNPLTGETKEAPVGFSWTTLLFGFFVPLFRGDWKWALIMAIIDSSTLGLSHIVWAFVYNKLYIKELISKGFKVKEVMNGNLEMARYKVGIPLEPLQKD